MTRSEILANRKTWIAYLKRPDIIKWEGSLSHPGNGWADDKYNNRCCLGHGCHALDIEFDAYAGYNSELTVKAGLWTPRGSTKSHAAIKKGVPSLQYLNDKTDATPQDIGEYLESVIEGGEDTPFKPLSMFDAG